MSLTVTVRPMTEKEREQLSQFSQPGVGLLEWLTDLILVPTVSGGLIGAILRAIGFEEDGAYAFGLVLGLIGGIWRLFSAIRENRQIWAGYAADRRAALADGVVHQISFSPRAAWEVGDVEEFGPAYLFDTGTDRAVFMCSQDLPISENGELAIGGVAAEAVPHADELLNLTIEPGTTPCHDEIVGIEELNLSVLSGCVLLPRTVLPGRA